MQFSNCIQRLKRSLCFGTITNKIKYCRFESFDWRIVCCKTSFIRLVSCFRKKYSLYFYFRFVTGSGEIGKLKVPELSGLQKAKWNIRLFLGAL